MARLVLQGFRGPLRKNRFGSQVEEERRKSRFRTRARTHTHTYPCGIRELLEAKVG